MKKGRSLCYPKVDLQIPPYAHTRYSQALVHLEGDLQRELRVKGPESVNQSILNEYTLVGGTKDA